MAVIIYIFMVVVDFIGYGCGERLSFCSGTNYCLSNYENIGNNLSQVDEYCSNIYGSEVTRISEISEDEKQILDKCEY